MSGRLIVVAGPTATGKTRLGIELARRLNGEIVSADSMQVYRGMDIGTAKASPEERAEKLHPADRRRIVRAIEVYRLTGRTISQHDAETRARPKRYEALRLVLNYADRADLYARIDRRVDEMLAAGLFEEVAGLLAAGLSAESTAMQAIGYKEAARALAGEISRSEAAEQIKQNSRRYAKRQLTWFGREKDAHWIIWEKQPDFDAALRQAEALLST